MRIAVISDIHGNLPALESVLEEIRAEEIGEMWCLGDVVGYYADPNECLSLVSQRCSAIVAGNHDYHVSLIGDHFERTINNWYNPHAAEALIWTRKQLTPENLEYLRSLPREKCPYLPANILSNQGDRKCKVLLTHGSPVDQSDEFGYVFPAGMEGDFIQWTKKIALIIALGHTHSPFAQVPRKGTLVFNPGSVGQPRDGDSRASYAILELEEEKKTKLSIKRVKYDIDETVNRMKGNNLPSFLSDRLYFGS